MSFIEGRMLINGRLVASESDQWIESIDPATEELIGRVPRGTSMDVASAVAAARAAQPAWARLAIPQRVASLCALADAIEREMEDIAAVETLDTGNLLEPMRRDVLGAAERIRFAAGYGYELKGMTIPGVQPNLHFTTRVPYGVVGRIVAFNHPFAFAAARIGSILIGGNTLVIKPSEQSPLSATRLASLCAETLPPGVVNIVTGAREAGEALVAHPDVKRLCFIGSVSTGRSIQELAARHAVKHISLELGGKNALVAFADTPVQAIADAAIAGMNFNWQGQSCGSTSRVLIESSVYDEVSALIARRVNEIRVGHPSDPAVGMGPINSSTQFRKVRFYIDKGQEEGAELLCGGDRPNGELYKRGFWVRPTVFGNVRPTMRIANEEIFGPVLSLMRFHTEAEAIQLANSVALGLTGSVWSRDIDRALRVAQEIEAGFVWINTVASHYRNVPFGGMKNSGVGREEGLADILSYTEEKAYNIGVAKG